MGPIERGGWGAVKKRSVSEWTSPEKVDSSLSQGHRLFELSRACLAQARVTTHPIVEHLNILKYLCLGLSFCLEPFVSDQFLLQGRKERFHHRIVPAVAATTHTAGNTGISQKLPVVAGGVLNAAIRMMQWLVHQPSPARCRPIPP